MFGKRLSTAIVCFQACLLLQLVPADAQDQDSPKYEYYVREKSENPKPRSFVDLRRFIVEPQESDTQAPDTQAPDSLEASSALEPTPSEPQQDLNDPRVPDTAPPARMIQDANTAALHRGIGPGLMSRAISRNNYNAHFASTAAYGGTPQTAITQTVTWRSPNFAHRPLYFQEVNLERYGNKTRWQPIHSGARFFGTVASLPYLAAAKNPRNCEFAMGYYRPGDCNPAHRQNNCMNRKRGTVLQVLATAALLSVL